MTRFVFNGAGRALLPVLLAVFFSGCSAGAGQQAVQRPPSAATPAASPTAPTAPTAQPEADDATERATSEPYTGDLSIFEDPERDKKLQIERVMDVLGIREGTAVADIGAGSGWFTVRAARRAGAVAPVYAVEINPDYLKHISERSAREKLPNVKTVLGKEDDPALPERSVDAVLVLKTYHEFARPVRLLRNLKRSLRPGARLGIIDREGKGDDHGVARDTVVREAERAGYQLVEEHDFVKGDGMDYLLVFRVRD
jgi:SAM-dependent methyltransferase